MLTIVNRSPLQSADHQMRLPVIKGLIERRILVNYRVDVDVLQRVLPPPFRVKQTSGVGIAGVCLIRMKRMRPRWLPSFAGLASENAAHRIAVEWDTADGVKEGVFVPRRDTSSAINVLVGGRVFPGKHSRAQFDVAESTDEFSVALRSNDGQTRVVVEASLAAEIPATSVFESIDEASTFFERGSIGYSATDRSDCFDCLELKSLHWQVLPLEVRRVESSFFSNTDMFPPGSVSFDSALLMRDIAHEWHAHRPLDVGTS